MASSLIGSLRVALSLGTAEFEAGAAKAATVARTRAKEIEGSFAGAKAAVSGLFAAFAVGALTEQIKKSLDYAGSLAEVSRTLGVTTKDLQTFRFAAQQSGVAQDQLEVGLRRLTVSMGKAELGSKAQAKAFEAIGISVAELKGKDTGDVFRLMADGLSKVTDRSQRAAIEMALMGRSGSTLDNLLAPGSKRLNELADAAQRLGIVLSDSQIQGAEETAHKLEALKTVLEAQIAGVVADNANAILGLANAIIKLTSLLPSALRAYQAFVAGLNLAGGALQALDPTNSAQGRAEGRTRVVAAQIQLRDLHNQQAGGSSLADRAAKFRAAIGGDLPKPKPTGTDLPQIFGGGGGRRARTPRAPTDRSDDVEFQFAQEQRQLDLQILDAKKQLSHDYVEQTTLSIQALDIEKAMRDADIDHKVQKAKQDAAEGKITQSALAQIVTDAGIEKAKEGKLDQLKRQAVLDAEAEQRFKDIQRLDNVNFDIQRQKLQSEEGLAQTAKERRDIELRLLDLAYQQERARLEAVQADKQATDAEKEEARRRLAALNGQYGLDRANVIQQTQGPLAQYLNSLPTTAAKWQEALQGVAVDGFGAITDSIDPLVSKIDKLGGVFGDVTRRILSDLLKLELEKRIIGPLVNALGGLFGGGIGAPDIGGLAPVNIGASPLAMPPPFATGGSLRILGNMGTDRNTLSLNGLPIARVSHGEDLSIGTGGGGGITINQTFAPQFAGNAATRDDLIQMAVMTKAATMQAINEKQRRRS